MTTDARNSRGQFAPGSKGNPGGRPRLTEGSIAARASNAIIEERLPSLIVHAMGRAETSDEVLAGICQLLAQRLRGQNLIAERQLLDATSH
ncbi:hypothetical protein BV326_04428 [Pseudomonas syringae pv. actinidiae]|uniref:DUF5681 domain-containing protein n=1 Tax=Pseudomonas syringae TaxID=317 RepID=UPI000A24C2AB|nr:DUF5681 domain-containing protein [Pseudomonas syringae]OSR67149.1 hypothetical protein BV326_04428 [Pseudomonas syringae pv. actinidiae]